MSKAKWEPYKFDCPSCKSVFNSHRKDAKYCSRTCAQAPRKQPPIIKTCLWCKEEFDSRAKNHGRELKRMHMRKFCSRKCMARERATYHNQEQHHQWKGGLFQDSGYVRINLYKKFGDKRYMPGLHRYIMMQQENRLFSYNEVVHHIDGDKQNNVLDNLVVLSRSYHSKLHYQQGDYFNVA